MISTFIDGVFIHREGETTQVIASAKHMTQAADGKRDATQIKEVTFEWKYSLSESPRDGVGADWRTGAINKISPYESVVQHRTGSPVIQGGDGYEYKDLWTPPDEAKIVKCGISFACRWEDPNDANHWPTVQAWTGHCVNPKADDEAKRRMAKPDAPTNVSATLQSGSDNLIYVRCNVGAEFATDVIVHRFTNGYTGPVVVGTFPKAQITTAPGILDRVDLGGTYYYRCYAVLGDGKTISDPSDFSSAVHTKTKAPYNLKAVYNGLVNQDGTTGTARLTWDHVGNCNGYEVRYNDVPDLDASSTRTASVPYSSMHQFDVGPLETGRTWYFQVKGKSDGADSDWSNKASCLLATTPDKPALAPMAMSYKVGDTANYSWTYANGDGSKQAGWQLRLTVDGVESVITSTDETKEETSYAFPLEGIANGASVEAQVRVKGLSGEYSYWSDVVTYTVYDAPDIGVLLKDGQDAPVSSVAPLTCLPLKAFTGLDSYPEGNAPITWSIQVIADGGYDSYDESGTPVHVADGQVLCDWRIDDDGTGSFPTGEFGIEIGPAAMRFEQGASYRVVASCATEAGLLSSSEPATFTVNMQALVPQPSFEASWDAGSMSARVAPSCYWFAAGTEEAELRPGTVLSIWRMSPGGEATLVADDIPNDGESACVDPHADFGSCTYRIVATDTQTGLQNWQDGIVPTPMNRAVAIWDESVQMVDAAGDPMPFMGKALFLGYNRDDNEQFSKDTAYREHAGARHPIARRGTQRGHKASSTFDLIASTDDYKLLRELEDYQGDCYVRTPWMPGFRADARLSSVNRTHDHPEKMAVSIEFTHVEDDRASSDEDSGIRMVTA